MKRILLVLIILITATGFSQTLDTIYKSVEIPLSDYGYENKTKEKKSGHKKRWRDPSFFGGLIISNYNMDARESSKFGIGASFTLWNVYFDISSNWVSGSGNYLDFQSSQSYDTGKTNIVSANLGYSLRMNEKFYFTPYLGMVASSDIWEDPIGSTTNFSTNRETKINLGGMIQYEPIHPLNICLGYGVYDGLKFGIMLDFTARSN